MWNLKKKKRYKWTHLNSFTDLENKLLMVNKGEDGGGGDKLGVWDLHIIHTNLFKIDN